MTRLTRPRRLFSVAAVLAVVGAIVIAVPRLARAFTLPPDIIFFDPVSVPVDHTLHVHLVNELGAGKVDFYVYVKPTTPAAGTPPAATTITLAPGDGIDLPYSFAGFGPPSGATAVPVVVTMLLSDSATGNPLPSEWPATVASAVEVTSDRTGVPIANLGGRHITRADAAGNFEPCPFCN